MKMPVSAKSFFFCFLFGIIFSFPAIAQNDRTIQLMQSIPQSNYTNPALVPMGKWYFGFPALSSLYVGYGNTAFNYHNVVHSRSQDDSLMLDPQKVLNRMHKRNYIGVDVNEEILAFGFKAKKPKMFFTFSLSEKASVRFCMPKDLFSLLWQGNAQFLDDNKKADFKWFGLNAIHYHELSLGASKVINDKLTLGIHAKLLIGLGNVRFKKSDISLYTNPSEDLAYDLTGDANVDVYSSIPGLTIYKNDTGYNRFDSVKVDFDAQKYITNFKNKGFAFDLGATYKLNDKISFAASVIDLCWINWKTNPQNFMDKSGAVTFDGIDFVQFLWQSDSVRKKLAQDMGDSLTKHFDLTPSEESYWAPLNTKVLLTGMYNLTEKDKIGVLVRGDFFNRTVHTSVTLSYNRKFYNWLYLTGSYSYYNRSFTNIGLGLAVLGGPFEFYVVSDNVLGDIWIENFQNIPIHFGINFIFGYKTPKDNKAIIN